MPGTHGEIVLQSSPMRLKPTLIALAAVAALPGFAHASPPGDSADLFDMSLEQLMDVVVTSVSKRSQPLSSAAAAVHVISAEDIRRSGATNLPWQIGRLAFQRGAAIVDVNPEENPFADLAVRLPRGFFARGSACDRLPAIVEALGT